jgi:hypothetical protein
MRELPILFSGAMVRALLDASKTQTRRVVKLPHDNPLGQWEPTIIGGPNGGRTAAGETVPLQGGIWHTRTGDCLMCPHGQPGDRLWVRETLKFVDTPTTRHDHVLYAADDVRVPRETGLVDWACDGMAFGFANSVPSIHMPRWASRISLEVTGVRVERLQDISEDDAYAEGAFAGAYEYDNGEGTETARESFQCLWDSLNAARGYGWDANPWVWVVEFRRVEA